MNDALNARGVFSLEHWRGDVCLYRETFPNTVVTVGKNQMLDAALAGAAYTVTGPFMGLISSIGFGGITAADTMASHAGWQEAGGAVAPTYTGARKTAAWSVAASGSKSLSAALTFALTSSGILKGAFLVFGSGAVDTKDNTSGVLLSAGLFVGGDRSVVSGESVNISYSMSL